jgi:hypothetical protein
MSNSAKYVKRGAPAGTAKGKGENRPNHAGVIRESIFLPEAAFLLG